MDSLGELRRGQTQAESTTGKGKLGQAEKMHMHFGLWICPPWPITMRTRLVF